MTLPRQARESDESALKVDPQLGADALLHAVIEMSDDAIFTCDGFGRITSWSKTAERLVGMAADEVRDRPLEALFPAYLHGDVRSMLSTVLAGDRIRHFESEMCRRDGMPMPASLSLSPLFDEARAEPVALRPLGVLVIARDVTEQRLDQATLAEFEARLEEGEALAHVGSWLWDLRTGAMQWSAEFHRIHGLDPVEFDGTFESFLALIHEEDRERLGTLMRRSSATGCSFECDYRVVPPGSVGMRRVLLHGQPTIGSSGEPVGLRGIGREVAASAAPAVGQS